MEQVAEPQKSQRHRWPFCPVCGTELAFMVYSCGLIELTCPYVLCDWVGPHVGEQPESWRLEHSRWTDKLMDGLGRHCCGDDACPSLAEIEHGSEEGVVD